VYGTPAWAKKDHAAVRVEVDAALQEYLAEHPDLQGIMKEGQEIRKRTLAHLERSPTGKRHRKKK